MSVASCPHCGASVSGGSFCGSCGKAVSAGTGGPQIVTGGKIASTGAGARLQSEELAKKARSAATALLAVAILSAIALALLAVLFNQPDLRVDWSIATPMLIGQALVTVIFFGLWIWARQSPLPAAIVGLVLYVSLVALNAFLDPATIAHGIIVKVIIVVVLIRAISAGLQHRQLLEAHGH